MEKTYNPSALEQKWYQTWEENGYFAASGEGNPYCIMIPPPNVTGTLHMGHAFQDTIMDALIRYNRMSGANTLWQPGTDHAGIATQMVVERQLNGEGKTRHDLGREDFLKRVWEWKEQSGGTITRQLRRMGASADWNRERFTMDDGLSEAVKEVFVRLYEDGLIYRGKRLVNWDPVLHTAVSDLEVENNEENGHMWEFRYPLTEGGGDLVVATTRPETMLGDSAVAVHPDDERYKHLVGKTVTLPLANREIPIVADDYVDPEFGTGCVKITPAHDFNDYEVGQRHDLPKINIFTIDAKINDEAPEKYRGMDRYDARKQIITDLDELGLLVSVKDHKLMVPRGDRSHTVIEPFLTDQWYVDLTRDEQEDGRPGGKKAIIDPSLECVRDGRIKFVPGNWDKTYFNWLEDIQDWCISRQLWWGHRIPAWYDEQGNVYVARSEEEARKNNDLGADVKLSQDEDVLDTWFSSALWPFSTLGWPEKTPELETFYPTSTLVTGFDIIFFWVARMVMMGNYFMGDVPFREVYIHGLVRDSEGQKMSKSKGNVLDPLDIMDGIDLESLVTKRTTGLMQPKMAPKIEKSTRKQFADGIEAYGTDALRFTFASLATTGRDVVFDMGRVEGFRNFCNKLWNAARYVFMNTEEHDTGITGDVSLSVADQWILSLLQKLEDKVNEDVKAYRFDLAAQAIYDFAWNEYCDWYLELSKPVLLKSDDEAQLRGTRQTLVRVLETLMRLLHPLMPYITEEIWQKTAPLAGVEGATIMTQPFPQSDSALINADAEAEIEWMKEFILGVRRIRGEMNIAPGKKLSIMVENASSEDIQRIERNSTFLKFLAKLENIEVLAAGQEAPESAISLVGEMKLLVPMAGLIDKDAELARLTKEMDKIRKDLEKSENKLNNPNFADKAPEAVVNNEKERVEEFKVALNQLQEQFDKISKL